MEVKMGNLLTARLDKLDVDVINLSTEFRRLTRSLSKLNPHFELYDKLGPTLCRINSKSIPDNQIPVVKAKPRPVSSYEPMDTEDNALYVQFSSSLKDSSDIPANIKSTKKWGFMHNERL